MGKKVRLRTGCASAGACVKPKIRWKRLAVGNQLSCSARDNSACSGWPIGMAPFQPSRYNRTSLYITGHLPDQDKQAIKQPSHHTFQHWHLHPLYLLRPSDSPDPYPVLTFTRFFSPIQLCSDLRFPIIADCLGPFSASGRMRIRC